MRYGFTEPLRILVPFLKTGTIIAFHLALWCWDSPATFAIEAVAAIEKNPETLLLDLEKPLEGHLAGGETRSYDLEVEAGYFFTITVDSLAIDSALRLYGPTGELLVERDFARRRQTPETLSWVADSTGRYRAEVLFVLPDIPFSPYRIVLETMREADEGDRNRVRAAVAVDEALRLRSVETADSLRKAIDAYEKAAGFWRAAEEIGAEAEAINAIGLLHRQMGNLKEALESYDKALDLWRRVGDRKGESMTLINTGRAYEALGETQRAIATFEEALSIPGAENDKFMYAFLINNLGSSHNDLGDADRALEHYQKALHLFREVGDWKGEAYALNNVATILWHRGSLDKAVRLLNESLSLKEKAADGAGQAATLGNLGTIHAEMREFERARSFFDRALTLQRLRGDRPNQVGLLTNLANVFRLQGDLSRAQELYTEALEIQRTIHNPRGEAVLLHSLGELLLSKGDEISAIKSLEAALVLRRQKSDLHGEALTLQTLGVAHRSTGNLAESERLLAQALRLWQESGNHPRAAGAQLDLAKTARRQGNLSKSLSEIQGALDIVESVRTETTRQAFRSSLLASKRSYYELTVELMMETSKIDRNAAATALHITERARARSLLEMLAESGPAIRRGAAPELLARETSLQRRINQVEQKRLRLFDGGAVKLEELTTLERELDDLLDDLDVLRAEIRALGPKYASLMQPEPLRSDQIQALLGPGTLLLSYFLGEERSFLWAVTSSSLTAHELPARAKIEAAARELHDLLSQSDRRLARGAAAQAASRLAGMILGPVEKLLGKNRLLIVADGALHYVPFAALPSPGRPGDPLVIEHEIVNLPSASVLAVLRKEMADRAPAPRQVAILADPVFRLNDPRVNPQAVVPQAEPPVEGEVVRRAAKDVGLDEFPRLRYTRQEAEAIASLLPPEQVLKALDFEASKETATRPDLSRYRILHFATHGLLDTRRPELSGLVLSLVDRQGRPRDGFLRLHEIYNLDLPADLVVLSGCETALGKEVRGEGLMALTRGFMYAGAPAVVASLWQIDDRSTGELMKRFYRGMIKERLSAPAALRKAQISLWKEKPTEAPYFWAGFVFQGDWQASSSPD